MACHCQSAGDWNRTCTETGDPLHTILNTDPRESTLTTGHELEREREKFILRHFVSMTELTVLDINEC